MAQPISTRRYNDFPAQTEPLPLQDAPLKLPDGRDFKPVLHRRAPAGFHDFCRSMLPRLRQRKDYRQRRLESANVAEFDLSDPARVPATYPKAELDELLKGIPTEK